MLVLGSIFVDFLIALFVIVCVVMMLVILIQKPKGGGLSGAFGGAGGGSTQAAFGAKVGDVLTWVTVVCFVLFLLLAMGLTWTIDGEVAAAKKIAPPQAQTKSTSTAGNSSTPGTSGTSSTSTKQPATSSKTTSTASKSAPATQPAH